MRIQEPVINKELVKQIKKELKLNEDIISFLVSTALVFNVFEDIFLEKYIYSFI